MDLVANSTGPGQGLRPQHGEEDRPNLDREETQGGQPGPRKKQQQQQQQKTQESQGRGNAGSNKAAYQLLTVSTQPPQQRLQQQQEPRQQQNNAASDNLLAGSRATHPGSSTGNTNADVNMNRPGAVSSAAPARHEVNSACQSCRKSRVRCEKVIPCKRCIRLNMECKPQLRGRGRPPSGKPDDQRNKTTKKRQTAASKIASATPGTRALGNQENVQHQAQAVPGLTSPHDKNGRMLGNYIGTIPTLGAASPPETGGGIQRTSSSGSLNKPGTPNFMANLLGPGTSPSGGLNYKIPFSFPSSGSTPSSNSSPLRSPGYDNQLSLWTMQHLMSVGASPHAGMGSTFTNANDRGYFGPGVSEQSAMPTPKNKSGKGQQQHRQRQQQQQQQQQQHQQQHQQQQQLSPTFGMPQPVGTPTAGLGIPMNNSSQLGKNETVDPLSALTRGGQPMNFEAQLHEYLFKTQLRQHAQQRNTTPGGTTMGRKHQEQVPAMMNREYCEPCQAMAQVLALEPIAHAPEGFSKLWHRVALKQRANTSVVDLANALAKRFKISLAQLSPPSEQETRTFLENSDFTSLWDTEDAAYLTIIVIDGSPSCDTNALWDKLFLTKSELGASPFPQSLAQLAPMMDGTELFQTMAEIAVAQPTPGRVARLTLRLYHRQTAALVHALVDINFEVNSQGSLARLSMRALGLPSGRVAPQGNVQPYLGLGTPGLLPGNFQIPQTFIISRTDRNAANHRTSPAHGGQAQGVNRSSRDVEKSVCKTTTLPHKQKKTDQERQQPQAGKKPKANTNAIRETPQESEPPVEDLKRQRRVGSWNEPVTKQPRTQSPATKGVLPTAIPVQDEDSILPRALANTRNQAADETDANPAQPHHKDKSNANEPEINPEKDT
mmetsp:Transcript_2010/g.3274  ORF Transcript_2010/g.3274 Transcript_2010/m.3274 type:complete len:887 (-) Transcript_2010:31-2691(-)